MVQTLVFGAPAACLAGADALSSYPLSIHIPQSFHSHDIHHSRITPMSTLTSRVRRPLVDLGMRIDVHVTEHRPIQHVVDDAG